MNRWMRERVQALQAEFPDYTPQGAYEIAHAEHKEALEKKRNKRKMRKGSQN
jgi:hypothetical protein